MKKCLQTIVVFLALSGLLNAQTILFDSFDQVPDSTRYDLQIIVVDGSDTSNVELSQETSIVAEGSAALRYDYLVEQAQPWGGFSKFQLFNLDSNAVWNFLPFENLVLRYYNDVPSSATGRVHLRILLTDVSDAPIDTYNGGNAELWYSFEYILDDAPGWNQIVLPLEDVGPDAFAGSNGFYRTGWAGLTGNDHLDLDKIKGIHFEISLDASGAPNSLVNGSVIFDELGFQGARELPQVYFNGKTFGAGFNTFAFAGGMTIEEGAGHEGDGSTNAIRWDQAPGQAWTGFGFLSDPQFLTFRWDLDSLKFWIKAPSGVGELRMVIASGDAPEQEAVYILQEPGGGYNDTWTQVGIPLSAFSNGVSFDTSAVNKFVFMSNGNGNGHTIFVDNLWTGNPAIDVIAPNAPVAPTVVTDNFSNLVTWLDVPGEEGETYNLYYSENPITDVSASGVQVVDLGLGRPENSGSWSHLLFSPLTDAVVSYYYAVTATDAAGNESAPGVTPSPISNTAKGIAVITQAPVNFAADGNLGEWSAIKPFELKPSAGSHIVTNTTIDGDGDLSYKVYLAVDKDYLYFAFDADDDVVDTTSANPWEKDSPDLFLGLYNQDGAAHLGYKRGSTPDYQLRFLPFRLEAANLGNVVVTNSTTGDYFWGTKFPIGYVIEGRVSWADLAAVAGDSVFSPQNGMRIPFDLALNDADGGGARQGIMTWSPYNDDTSWQSPKFWLNTWTEGIVVGIGDDLAGIPETYKLEQNYPNPFNPSTTIVYRLPQASDVTLVIYNALGQKVKTLINEKQNAGTYNITFNPKDLATGVYFYRLKANDFSQVRKMLLMK